MNSEYRNSESALFHLGKSCRELCIQLFRVSICELPIVRLKRRDIFPCAEGATDLSRLGNGERNSVKPEAREGRASPISPGLRGGPSGSDRTTPGNYSTKYIPRPWERERMSAGQVRVVRKTSTIRWRKFYLAAASLRTRSKRNQFLGIRSRSGSSFPCFFNWRWLLTQTPSPGFSSHLVGTLQSPYLALY